MAVLNTALYTHARTWVSRPGLCHLIERAAMAMRGQPHICTGCQAPVSREPAEELWFHATDATILESLHLALGEHGIVHHCVPALIKVPLVTAAWPVVKCVMDALSAQDVESVRVVWLIRGVEARAAHIDRAPTLPLLYQELQHAWFLQALDERQLYMHFQPIVSLRDRTLLAHEALVRAQHNEREVSGGEIVALATTLGLLVPLDARTRVAAIEEFAASPLPGKLFINFQPSAIYDPRFCLRTTLAALKQSRLSPQDIVFEVVESDEIDDLSHLQDIVSVYRSHGMQFAMDDFGAGYSTPERFMVLRPDFVKLDKKLTTEAGSDPYVRKIISEIVTMSTEFGCRVIGEGIETRTQRDLLIELGVELGQGYLFARPARLPVINQAAFD